MADPASASLIDGTAQATVRRQTRLSDWATIVYHHTSLQSTMPGSYRVHADGQYLYFVTSTIVNWLPLFESPRACDILLDAFTYCRQRKGLLLHAYVIMPTHFHAIVSSDPASRLSGIMRDFKRFTSCEITRVLAEQSAWDTLHILSELAATGKGNTDYKVWQDGYHPIAIFSQPFLRQKLNYIHNNPVRKCFVERPEEWRFSSAAEYLAGTAGVIEIDRLLM